MKYRLRTMAGILGIAMLAASVSCGGAGVEPASDTPERAELANPAEDGEDALASLPKLNPPLGAADPRLVGSSEMTEAEFVQAVSSDLNAKWGALFEESGYLYSNADVVIFTEPIPIAGCEGVADPARGPFYCAETMTVYWPPEWEDASGQTPAEIGDFTVATILAHEIGHHVQYLAGVLGDPEVLTIEKELQADCYAGLWGRTVYEQELLEEGDIGEALESLANAADLPGTPVTDPGAHGTESQRVNAYFLGYESGDTAECQL